MRQRRDRVAAADHRGAARGGERARHRERAVRERLDLEDPHRPVPQDGPCASDLRAEVLGGPRADVDAEEVGGEVVGGHDGGPGAGLGTVRREVIDGQQHAHPLRGGALERVVRDADLVLLDARAADRLAGGAEERVRHRAADAEGVDAAEEVLDDADLVRYLGAAEDGDERRLGRAEEAREELDLAEEEEARRLLAEVLRHARGRRVRAVGGTERVVHVDVRQTRERPGEARVVRLLLGVEAEVLEQDRAVGPADEPLRRVADAVGRERDAPVEHLSQILADGRERQLGARLALRAPEVRRDHGPAAVVEHETDGWQSGVDPGGVGDAAVGERDIQVGADEDALAPDVQVRDRPHVPAAFKRGCVRRATPRPASASRNPTRCRTRTAPCRTSCRAPA